MDKMKRGVNKLRDPNSKTARSSSLSRKLLSLLQKPPKICIAIGLILLCASLYAVYILSSISSASSESRFLFSKEVLELRQTFLNKLTQSTQHPEQTAFTSIHVAENTAFIRTPVVDALYAYIRAASRELNAEQINANPSYRDVQCIQAFTPGVQQQLPEFEQAVHAFLDRQQGSTWSQEFITGIVTREVITESNDGGLPSVVGQHGVVALLDIEANTCIGHYHGDEMLMAEFEQLFPWTEYGTRLDHPFNKKWDYYMTVPYHIFADPRFGLRDLKVDIAIDAFHSYDHEQYAQDRGLVEKEDVDAKVNLEIFVNDAREQLYEAEMRPEDRARKNSEFVYCTIDGVIHPFFVVTDDIQKGQQLFNYYGPDYG